MFACRFGYQFTITPKIISKWEVMASIQGISEYAGEGRGTSRKYQFWNATLPRYDISKIMAHKLRKVGDILLQ